MSNTANMSQPSLFKYHKFHWQNGSKGGVRKFTDDNGRKIRLYKREYDNQGALFYVNSYVFPTMYIYSCGFIGQLYEYCQNIKKKYKKKSVAAAFSNCPTIYMLIKDGRFENCHLESLTFSGETHMCLAVCYPSFVISKKAMYNRLAAVEEKLKAEVPLINRYELISKWGTVKKIGAGALKVAAKVGVALVAGVVGGNLDIDLPDFDFGSVLPDFDFDFDFDMDVDTDVDTDVDLDVDTDANMVPDMSLDTDLDISDQQDSDLGLGNGVSFGASPNSDGYIHQGSITLQRTVSDIKDSFPHYTKDGHDYVKLSSGIYVRVDQGVSVTLNGIKYDTV